MDKTELFRAFIEEADLNKSHVSMNFHCKDVIEFDTLLRKFTYDYGCKVIRHYLDDPFRPNADIYLRYPDRDAYSHICIFLPDEHPHSRRPSYR